MTWLILAVLPFLSAKNPGSVTVSMNDFIKLVLKNNPSLKEASLQVNRYEAMLKGAKLLYFPQITLSVQGAPSPKYKCMVPQEWMNLVDLGGMSEKEFRETYCLTTDRDDNITLDLDGYVVRFEAKATFPLYTFGKIEYAKELANAGVRYSEANMKSVREKVIFTAKKAWLSSHAAAELMKLLDESQKLMKKSLEKAEKMEEDGKITPTDLIRLKLGENELNLRALEIKKLNSISIQAMKILAGKDVTIDASKSVEDPSEVKPQEVSILLKKAMGNRPEFAMISAARAAAKARHGLAKAAFKPNIGLFLRYRLTLSNSEDPKSAYLNDGLHGNSLAFGLGLEMKFDPSKMLTDLRLARVESRMANVKLTAARDFLKMQISTVRENIIYQIDKLSIIKRGIKLSRGWLIALEDQEAMNVVKPKEMVDALVSYFKLRFALIEASWALRLEWLKLHALTEKPGVL
ncbi:TolC family protein [Myxococcota bacterium]|nr:TolC family protein [Myxococcota bacterium]MBU1383170.1 TolC family protein [Myxococcota bacterium]MBU1497194.1 TolC family protein [Myxococcota bacterium]